MTKFFITGDIHGEYHITKLYRHNWPTGASLSDHDYLIIAGDFGLLFTPEPTKTEKHWLKWLEDRHWTTLFICGNHDNHDMLNALPREEKFGGVVGKVSNKIYHLLRGEVYTIGDKKFLTFGGAMSSDKETRKIGISWWNDEIPNYADMENCLTNLEKHQNKVDFIVAHTCPLRLKLELSQVKQLGFNLHTMEDDPTVKMLEHIVSICEFEKFYCGHWHLDQTFDKYNFLFKKIKQIC